MEQKATNKFIGNVDVGCRSLESISNHLVGAVNVGHTFVGNNHLVGTVATDFGFRSGYQRLNTKINSMLTNHVLCDVDVRDLVSIVDELGLRSHWKEMNAKIRAELEGISKHVAAATEVLDANPPAYQYRNVVLPGYVSAPLAHSCTFKMEEAPKAIQFSLAELPWQKWNIKMNNDVAKAHVEEIIPVKEQKVVRKLFGECDALMEDVLAWHRMGFYRYNCRMSMC